MANVPRYLPSLLGPVVIAWDGTAQTARPTINFVGGTVTDDDVNDRLDVDMSVMPSLDVGDPGFESGGVNYVGSTYPADFKVNVFGSSVVAAAIFHRHSTVDGCNVLFTRAKSDTSSHATVASGDVISRLIFAGHDGTDYNPCAYLTARIAGTVGANDMPGALDFHTTPDGSNAPVLALTIDQEQRVVFAKSPKLPAAAVAALAIDWAAANVHTKTLAAGGNTFTFSNASSGMVIIVRLTSHASGSTVTWPTVKWAGGAAPTQSTPSKTDVYTFVHDGTDIYGSVVQDLS